MFDAQPKWGYNPYNHWGNGPWYLDSGAIGHIAVDYQKLDRPPTSSGVEISEIKTDGGESHTIAGTSSATVTTESGAIKLKSVKYVPSMQKNLMSVGAIADFGHRIVFSNHECWIINLQGQIVASGRRDPKNGLYACDRNTIVLSAESQDITNLWHCRFGHLSFSGLSFLSKNSHVHGLPKIELDKQICTCCMDGRQHRERFLKHSETRALKPGFRIHTDLMGPMQQESLGGSRYTLVFTDDFSCKSWVYFLKSKGETLTKFRHFKNQIETETGNPIQVLCSDRGGEYLSDEFSTFCKENGIRRKPIQVHTPQQNGVSKRRNKTIMERAQSISHNNNLPIYLWTEAVSHAVYLINRNPTRANSGETPEERYSGIIPDISNLRIFGCIALVHIPKEHRKKLESKTQTCIFLGFDSETKGYCLFDHHRKKVIISHDVVFDEARIGLNFLGPREAISETFEIMQRETPPDFPTDECPTKSIEFLNLETENPSSLEFPDTYQNNFSSVPNEAIVHPNRPAPVDRTSGPPARRYPNRCRQPSVRLRDFWTLTSELMEEPLDFNSASQDAKWQSAIQKEVDAILRNRTWDIIDRPSNRKPITAKWIFKLKRTTEGVVNKLKARIVARGFQQKEGIDYNEIFAPVDKWSTILLILALAAKHNWPLHQMDVISAFLNGTINEDILMEIREGFPSAGDDTKVCQIKRALYGLKQLLKAWYDRINSWLQEHGFIRSECDSNLYFTNKNGKTTILLLYVDDLIIIGNDTENIKNLKSKLHEDFEMTDLGAASHYLGIEIHRKEEGIFIHQQGYIQKLLQKFNLENCNPVKLPIDPSTIL